MCKDWLKSATEFMGGFAKIVWPALFAIALRYNEIYLALRKPFPFLPADQPEWMSYLLEIAVGIILLGGAIAVFHKKRMALAKARRRADEYAVQQNAIDKIEKYRSDGTHRLLNPNPTPDPHYGLLAWKGEVEKFRNEVEQFLRETMNSEQVAGEFRTLTGVGSVRVPAWATAERANYVALWHQLMALKDIARRYQVELHKDALRKD